MLDLEPVE
jgi:hypothetical protein